jgi:hypothetical protein
MAIFKRFIPANLRVMRRTGVDRRQAGGARTAPRWPDRFRAAKMAKRDG